MIRWLTTVLVTVLFADSIQVPAVTVGSMDPVTAVDDGECCWTDWFDRDDPSGTGDWETLNALHIMYPGRICQSPLDIEVQTVCGLSVDTTGNIIHVSDPVTGFICRNSDQTECHHTCQDYRVRFKCPLSFCTPTRRWTDWFDRDDPADSGDWEVLGVLRTENPGKICDNPFQMEVQTTSGLSVASTGDVIAVSDTVTGFVCKNSDQPSCKMCQDYRVRFLCPYEFFIQPQCWTDWFDRDNPSGTGDWETLKDLRKEHPDRVCDIPLQIEVRTTAGLIVPLTGNVISVSDTTTGFVCKNSDQETGMCYDYRVRFMCPPDFCAPKAPGCFTDWFDLDDPSGFGDSETLAIIRDEFPERICNEPQQIQVLTLSGLTVEETENQIHVADAVTGFVCKNDEQTQGTCHDFRVRFRCPTDFCAQKVCWTDWFDRDDPTASGDWELLSDLRKKYPEDICEKPLAIEVVTVDTNTPITSTGQATYLHSPTVGFVCRNQDQSCHQCFDYKVRFGCPCPCED